MDKDKEALVTQPTFNSLGAATTYYQNECLGIMQAETGRLNSST